MKLRQTARHWAFKQALTAPVVGEVAREKLVDLHTRVFLKRADPDHAEERREHLGALFEATTETYVAALGAGHTEAGAREITHVQANFDFYNHGWTEMMEFPADEVEAHYDRHAEFFSAHGITIDDPLGEFRDEPLPPAPSTPEKLDDPDHPHAEGGFADDVYVERDGDVVVDEGRETDDAETADTP